jgi:Cytochrome P450
LMFAGSDTVSNVLMIGFFHLLQRPSIQKRLRDELLESWPELHNAPTFETLETLPLLTAVVKESLRISPNITTPCERIVPAAGAVISVWGFLLGRSSACRPSLCTIPPRFSEMRKHTIQTDGSQRTRSRWTNGS